MIDKIAAGKTAAIIAGIWLWMLVADLMHPASQHSVGASDGIADMVRSVFNLNGDTTSSDASAGDIKGDGLTLIDKDGTVLVASVKVGSLAERSGFKVGDRIKAINRNRLHNVADSAKYYAGQGSTFNVERNGISVYPPIEAGKVRPIENMLPGTTAAQVVGLEVVDMVGMYPVGIHAPMTMNPAPGGLAEKAGIKAEQWITAVNGKNITTSAEYRQLSAGDGPLSITVVDISSNPRQTKEIKLR